MAKLCKTIFLIFVLMLLTVVTNVCAVDFKWQVGDTISPSFWANQDIDAEPGTYYDGENFYLIHSTGEGATRTRVNNWKCYKGTSMDDLAEVSSFSADFDRPHGDDRYWLSGLWVDEETGVWYTTVHDEFNYLNTTEITQHERYILYAKSYDKGATWTLCDVIISPDDPAQASNDNSGRYTPFGCGDQKMFVDTEGGYIYIYYMKMWSDTKTGYMFKTCNAARSPISEKMAAGSWQKWYNGRWCEDGLGGHETPLFSPPCTGVYVGYNTYLERYIAIGMQKESDELFISTCQNMDEQDWSTPERFAANSYSGWYNWCFDTETMSRDITGKSFRLYRASHTSKPLSYNDITIDSGESYSNKSYYPDYSYLQGRIYAHNSIMEMIPDYAYRCDFSEGKDNMSTVGTTADLSVVRQQKMLQIETTGQTFVIDSNAPDMSKGVFDFTAIVDDTEEFGAVMNYDENGNYEMLRYSKGVFTWETRDNEPVMLFKSHLVYGKAYSFNIRLINNKLAVQIDQNIMFEGDVYECSAKAGKYGFLTQSTLLVDNVSRYDGVQVIIDGAEFAMDYKPEIKGTTIMLPLVRLSQIFAMEVKTADNNITITIGKKQVTAVLGNKSIKVGSVTYTLPEAPYMSDNQVMIPVQLLNRLGMTASVDIDDKTVNIRSNNLLKIKLQNIEPLPIKQLRKTGKNGIADYFEDYKTDYITEGELMYKDNSTSASAKRLIYRRFADKTAERIYRLEERDIASVELKVLVAGTNVNRYIQCYVSDDGETWTNIPMTSSNKSADSATGMNYYDFSNKNIGAGYRYLKVQLLAKDLNWSAQIGYVIINGDMAVIDEAEKEIAPSEYVKENINLLSRTYNGADIKWTIPQNPYIDSEGNLKAVPSLGEGVQKIDISAQITYGETTDVRTFTVTVSEPTGNIVKAFTDCKAGTRLKDIEAEPDSGWSGKYSVNIGDADEMKVVSTPYGNMLSLVSGEKRGVKNYEISRALSRKMDFDSDKTYYIVWNQRMDGYGNVKYRNQRLVLSGANVNSESAEIAGIASINNQLTDKNIENNVFDKDYFPVYMMLKAGNVTDYPTIKEFSFVKGQMYTMVIRIDAVHTGNDHIYMKAYPTGTAAPTEWNAHIECEITGKADTVTLYGMNDTPTSAIQYGNFQADSIAKGDETAYIGTEAAIRAGNKALAEEMFARLDEGAWKTVLRDELAGLKDLKIGAVTFKQDDIRISKLEKNGNIEISAEVTNNTDSTKECCMIAAWYDCSEIKGIDMSPAVQIEGKTSEDFTLMIANDKDLTDEAYIRVFFWDNTEEMNSVATPMMIDKTMIVQKNAGYINGNRFLRSE